MENLISRSVSVTDVSRKRISEVRFLTKNTFIIRFDRVNFQFVAGQHIIVGPKGHLNQREYSIYSGENSEFLEILVKEVLHGNVSVQLKNCKPGELLEVNGPFGSFRLEPYNMFSKKYMFIATGTGISPFHSFVTSFPGIDYTILHGIRDISEAYEMEVYDPARYKPCVSQGKAGSFHGRVTHFLPEYKDEPGMLYYICGNNNMIYDVCRILRNKGVTSERIFTEVYF
ncbi:MAG: FAD-dependent oxidoreductase [Bacteroidia bacterium]|nr:FAD-dependent oxidoreductase [Bacteroidia bacterium]